MLRDEEVDGTAAEWKEEEHVIAEANDLGRERRSGRPA